MRDWTMDDLATLQHREDSSVKVYHYNDGRDIVHTTSGAWLWDREAGDWVVATESDMRPSVTSPPASTD